MQNPELKTAYFELKGILKTIPGSCCPKGWSKVVLEGHKKITSLYPEIGVAQIKEKFAGLRYYYTAPVEQRPYIDEIIYEMDDKCSVTCMTCGEPGTERQDGWISVLCDKCFEEKRPSST